MTRVVHTAGFGSRILPALCVAFALCQSGCTLGPDYHGPPVVAQARMDAPSFRAASAEYFISAPPLEKWWSKFDEPALEQIVEEALARSPTVEVARGRLLAARSMVAMQRAKTFPMGSLGARSAHVRVPSSGFSAFAGGEPADAINLNLYSAGFDASWEADLFGGGRRAIEAARARAEGAEALLRDAQLQLVADIGQAYIALRDAQNRQLLLVRAVEIERHILKLTRQRFENGLANEGEIARWVFQLAQTEAELPGTTHQIDEAASLIAFLAGREAGELPPSLVAPKPLVLPAGPVAVGDPATFIRRRPDIRLAERQLAASTAMIGEAVALTGC